MSEETINVEQAESTNVAESNDSSEQTQETQEQTPSKLDSDLVIKSTKKLAQARNLEKQYKQQLKELEEQKAQIAADKQKYKQLFKENPEQALKELELSYDSIYEAMISKFLPQEKDKEKPEELLKKEIEEVKRKLQEKEELEVRQREEQEVQKARMYVAELVDSDQFPFLEEHLQDLKTNNIDAIGELTEAAFKVILNHYEAGQKLNWKDALELLEIGLEKEVKRYNSWHNNVLSKKSKKEPEIVEDKDLIKGDDFFSKISNAVEKKANHVNPQPKTLSNSVSQTNSKLKQMTPEEEQEALKKEIRMMLQGIKE